MTRPIQLSLFVSCLTVIFLYFFSNYFNQLSSLGRIAVFFIGIVWLFFSSGLILKNISLLGFSLGVNLVILCLMFFAGIWAWIMPSGFDRLFSVGEKDAWEAITFTSLSFWLMLVFFLVRSKFVSSEV